LIDLANVPVLISRPLELRRYTRVVIALDHAQLANTVMAELVWMIGHRISQHLSVPLVLETNADELGLQRAVSVTGNVAGVFVPPFQEASASGDLIIAPVVEGYDRWAQLYVSIPRNKPITTASSTRSGRMDCL
ncbi:MAG: hypothetical protein HKO10_00410, partial [Acidimicrobiia bacterium]|nr:hypothetical protein [Acidimicrobiia bacterium]